MLGDRASALGLGHELGQLTPGFLADCIAVDFQAPQLCPTYHPESHLVYTAGGADVRHTIVQGKALMEDRRLLTLDLEEIRGQVRAFAEVVKGA